MFLDVCKGMGCEADTGSLVLSRADSTGGINVEDIEESLHHKVVARLVSAGALVTVSINSGTPFVLSQPEAAISRNTFTLVRQLLTEADAQRFESVDQPEPVAPRAGFGLRRPRLFPRKGAD